MVLERGEKGEEKAILIFFLGLWKCGLLSNPTLCSLTSSDHEIYLKITQNQRHPYGNFLCQFRTSKSFSFSLSPLMKCIPFSRCNFPDMGFFEKYYVIGLGTFSFHFLKLKKKKKTTFLSDI